MHFLYSQYSTGLSWVAPAEDNTLSHIVFKLTLKDLGHCDNNQGSCLMWEEKVNKKHKLIIDKPSHKRLSLTTCESVLRTVRESTKKMIVSICLLVFFCCGLNFAQPEDELSISKTEFDALKEKLEILETKLRDTEMRQINSVSQIAELKNEGKLINVNIYCYYY